MEFTDLLTGLQNNKFEEMDSININNDIKKPLTVFDVNSFIRELKLKSASDNRYFHDSSERFNAYDLAHNCIRSVLFRIFKYPLKDYSDSWLPVKLRTRLGTACHEFVQSSSIFTEQETYLRILSENISVKLDCLINNNVLVEIKSCNYTDYSQIIKTNLPRTKDLFQSILYKHLLETHLDEAKEQVYTERESRKYNHPKLDKYKIEQLQFIYICHELVSAETESIEEDIEFSKRLKKFLKSRNNKFWFIKTIELDLSKFNIVNMERAMVDKLNELNKYRKLKQIPEMTNKYVDKKACFFCLFKEICSTVK
ncbi:MAG: hypothetical protein IPH62_19515 [Ignavibacteriae bacterium]|nr:hypothetical protein [Ignavibacteriota bacterium]